jgi:FkbM family methyltransferase
MKVIYDLGANQGDNIPYYLLKADKVVAVEANPTLCTLISERFAEEILAGSLVVENCVVTEDDIPSTVDFYVHRSNSVLSQFPKPQSNVIHNFDRVSLPSISAPVIIRRHGSPWFIKIDIEHFDHVVLKTLFHAGIYPDYLSAESHCVDVFALLIAEGRYSAFKLVDGVSVAACFHDCLIRDFHGDSEVRYSFPFDSAGPFGNDIPGGWMTSSNFLRKLAFENLGWKDIHVSRVDEADPAEMASLQEFILREASFSDMIPLFQSLETGQQLQTLCKFTRLFCKSKLQNLTWKLQSIMRLNMSS